jgi:hypothetical protein
MISSPPKRLQRIVAICFLLSLTYCSSKSEKAIVGEWRAEGAGGQVTFGASSDGQVVFRTPDPGGRMTEFKGTYALVKAASDGAEFRISIPKQPHTPETQGKVKLIGDTLTLTLFSDAKSSDTAQAIPFRKISSNPPVIAAAPSTSEARSGSDRPSESQARAALENEIASQSNGAIKLVSFQKTNGIQRDLNGIKGYELEYAAEIEFTDDCLWSDRDGYFEIFRLPLSPADKQLLGTMQAPAWTMRARQMKKGEHYTTRGSFQFIQTENGWRLNQRQ